VTEVQAERIQNRGVVLILPEILLFSASRWLWGAHSLVSYIHRECRHWVLKLITHLYSWRGYDVWSHASTLQCVFIAWCWATLCSLVSTLCHRPRGYHRCSSSALGIESPWLMVGVYCTCDSLTWNYGENCIYCWWNRS